jgi:hypothetical protein
MLGSGQESFYWGLWALMGYVALVGVAVCLVLICETKESWIFCKMFFVIAVSLISLSYMRQSHQMAIYIYASQHEDGYNQGQIYFWSRSTVYHSVLYIPSEQDRTELSQGIVPKNLKSLFEGPERFVAEKITDRSMLISYED